MQPRANRSRPGRAAWLAVLGLTVPALAARTQEPAARAPFAEEELEYFEAKVRPLLAAHCYECHSSQSRRVKGDLRLDTPGDLLRGGESGEIAVAGQPEQSALIAAVRYTGDVRMPPDGPLAPEQVRVLEDWVRRGMPMPAAAPAAPAEDWSSEATKRLGSHWAFQALADPSPPPVIDAAWCANEIDRFVLARLEAQGLRPARRADPRTLLRRLSIDLTGLPPSAEELDRFAADPSPESWQREIDRLLASPHYGERWGRAWLDLARYSDSNGLDENLAMATAFRYRDWVVRACNQDLPYDQFLTLQLAGDLLPEPADAERVSDQLLATGFLALGPKMLAEQDKQKLVLDVVDEQIDVAFRAFQGMTLGCARCHDHKFDPISQRDYTAVAGIFRSTATLANLDFVSRWNERELAPRARIEAFHAHAARRDAAKAELAKLRAKAEEALLTQWKSDTGAYLMAAEVAARDSLVVEAEEASRGNLIRDDSTYGSKDVVVARTGAAGLQFAEYDLTFAASGTHRLEIRMAAEESRPVRVLLDGAPVLEAVLGLTTGSWGTGGQRWVHAGPLRVHSGRNVLRLERDGAMPHLDRILLVPEEADGSWPVAGNPWAAGLEPALVRNFALRLESAQQHADPIFGPWTRFAALDEAAFETEAPRLCAELAASLATGSLVLDSRVAGLIDGLPPKSLRELAGRYQVLFAAIDADWRELRAAMPDAQRLPGDGAEALRRLLHGEASLFHLAPQEVEPLYPPAVRDEVAAAREGLEELERTLPARFDTAPGVRDAAEVADMTLMRRGNHLDPGAVVPRGVPATLAPGVPVPLVPPEASGRLELARWMLDPEHPLTSRVAVNRLWQGHFGAGIVRSSSNFGLRGDVPSHPELLDWLAREFVRRGWSAKAMHRLICSSSTYRMECSAESDDPEGRLLARQNRRRLDAESLRDALLCASGELDRTLGGSLLEIGNGDYVTNDQSKDAARYDAPRRSLYLPIIRNAMLDLFSAFDYPDSSVTVELRPSTTNPSQSLYLMNSPLVLRCSATIARTALEAGAGERERVHAVYRAALGRAPLEDEIARAVRFVASTGVPAASARANVGVASPAEPAEDSLRREREVWALLAQALLMSNEFLFVE